jgi:hypothetical protein
MPTIAYFYGIAVQMFYGDHNPPHFRARYGRARALVRISDGKVISGELPPTATRLIRAWALARRRELEGQLGPWIVASGDGTYRWAGRR